MSYTTAFFEILADILLHVWVTAVLAWEGADGDLDIFQYVWVAVVLAWQGADGYVDLGDNEKPQEPEAPPKRSDLGLSKPPAQSLMTPAGERKFALRYAKRLLHNQRKRDGLNLSSAPKPTPFQTPAPLLALLPSSTPLIPSLPTSMATPAADDGLDEGPEAEVELPSTAAPEGLDGGPEASQESTPAAVVKTVFEPPQGALKGLEKEEPEKKEVARARTVTPASGPLLLDKTSTLLATAGNAGGQEPVAVLKVCGPSLPPSPPLSLASASPSEVPGGEEEGRNMPEAPQERERDDTAVEEVLVAPQEKEKKEIVFEQEENWRKSSDTEWRKAQGALELDRMFLEGRERRRREADERARQVREEETEQRERERKREREREEYEEQDEGTAKQEEMEEMEEEQAEEKEEKEKVVEEKDEKTEEETEEDQKDQDVKQGWTQDANVHGASPVRALADDIPEAEEMEGCVPAPLAIDDFAVAEEREGCLPAPLVVDRASTKEDEMEGCLPAPLVAVDNATAREDEMEGCLPAPLAVDNTMVREEEMKDPEPLPAPILAVVEDETMEDAEAFAVDLPIADDFTRDEQMSDAEPVPVSASVNTCLAPEEEMRDADPAPAPLEGGSGSTCDREMQDDEFPPLPVEVTMAAVDSPTTRVASHAQTAGLAVAIAAPERPDVEMAGLAGRPIADRLPQWRIDWIKAAIETKPHVMQGSQSRKRKAEDNQYLTARARPQPPKSDDEHPHHLRKLQYFEKLAGDMASFLKSSGVTYDLTAFILFHIRAILEPRANSNWRKVVAERKRLAINVQWVKDILGILNLYVWLIRWGMHGAASSTEVRHWLASMVNCAQSAYAGNHLGHQLWLFQRFLEVECSPLMPNSGAYELWRDLLLKAREASALTLEQIICHNERALRRR